MKALEETLKVVLGFFLLLDVVVIFRFWLNGWPGSIVVMDLGGGRITAEAIEIPFTLRDWLVVVVFVGLQVVLGYAAWRLRRPPLPLFKTF